MFINYAGVLLKIIMYDGADGFEKRRHWYTPQVQHGTEPYPLMEVQKLPYSYIIQLLLTLTYH
jgi:hypothetical protein